MCGLRPGIDIEIIETQLRPGEKLHEELWWETEDAVPSSHPLIRLAPVGSAPKSVAALLPLIRDLVDRDAEGPLRHVLEEAVGLEHARRDGGRAAEARASLSA
jgi:FlaA1/EpsC-like NDP-sugar epimerase